VRPEAVPAQVVAVLAGLAQARVAERVLAAVLAARVGRTLQEVQAAQCQAPLAKVLMQEWAAGAPRAPARPIPAQAQTPKSVGSSLESGCRTSRQCADPTPLSDLGGLFCSRKALILPALRAAEGRALPELQISLTSWTCSATRGRSRMSNHCEQPGPRRV
jgi:hypothetical protein